MDRRVTYRFGRNDYIALLRANRAMGRLGRLGRWGRAALFSLVLVALSTAVSYDSLLHDPVPILLLDVVLFGVLFLVAPIGERLGEWALARWIFPRYSVAEKELTLELGDEGIRSQIGAIESRIPWSSIVRAMATGDYLFLSLSRAEMIAVPERATSSPEAFAELVRYVNARVGAPAAP
jgi:hypothetical protein